MTSYYKLLQKNFPHIPTGRLQLYARLAVAMIVLVSVIIAVFVHGIKKKLGVESLWFQFSGAATLWWESNATNNINLAVDELKLNTPSLPLTRAEKYMDKTSRFASNAIFLICGIVAAFSIIRINMNRGVYYILLFTIALVVAYCLIIFTMRVVNRWFEKIAIQIESIQPLDDAGLFRQQQIARRAVRTIGFAFIALSTILLIYPTVIE